jgi:DNA-3-methyladenine glycosylase
MTKLQQKFYLQPDVVALARDLLGKLLVTRFDGATTIARIVETEAYAGVADRASHAYGDRHTPRTAVMYAPGGTAYVYLCYGIHHLFNVVTNVAGIPHAVLIRAAEPVKGVDIMLQRTGKPLADHCLTRGPGNLSRAMGIDRQHTGLSLLGSKIYLAADGFLPAKKDIIATARIGVDYAGQDALLPYRFLLKDSPYVSGKKS